MMTANDFLTAMELLNHTTSMAAPAAYRDRVEKMFEYGVYISDQRGFAPRNGGQCTLSPSNSFLLSPPFPLSHPPHLFLFGIYFAIALLGCGFDVLPHFQNRCLCHLKIHGL